MKSWRTMTFIACAALASCGQHNHHEHAEEADEHTHHEGVIVLTKAQSDAAHVTTETLKADDFEECLRVGGQVITAQGDEQALTARSSGIVSFARLHLTEGVAVNQGETLARISASNMAGGDVVAQQSSALTAAKMALERAERLKEDTLISRKEYERIRQEYEQARLAASGSRAGSGSVVQSPLTGYLRTIFVKQGEYVEAGSVIATVTKNCNLQLRAEVPEKYYRHIGDIRSAMFQMSYGGEVHRLDSLHGRLVSVGQSASESSAYIPVTFEFVNDGCIVAGSFADVWLLTTSRANVLSVPNEAITEEQGLHYIYIALPADDPEHREFEKRLITLGARNGQRTEITEGVKPGEQIVVKGVTQVKLAASAANIPDAHNHAH